MIARLSAWWRARQLRVLKERTYAAAGNYLAFKARYEAALLEEKRNDHPSD